MTRQLIVGSLYLNYNIVSNYYYIVGNYYYIVGNYYYIELSMITTVYYAVIRPKSIKLSKKSFQQKKDC